ncbi:hypothetical protein [Thermoflavimicrobium daqui]|nr:hypothetical protein [Thermoflavimicrobium daqui]
MSKWVSFFYFFLTYIFELAWYEAVSVSLILGAIGFVFFCIVFGRSIRT